MTGDGRLNAELAALHIRELLGAAERRRLASAGPPRVTVLRSLALRFRVRRRLPTAADRAVLELRIRYAGPGDEPAIARLAALDSARAPDPPLLLAEVDGTVLVAMSLWDGRAIADPFRHTQALAELLAVRAAQIESAAGAFDELRGAARHWERRPEPRGG